MPAIVTRGREPARLRVGILANEFFDPALGPMGGFGWAAARVAALFRERPELGRTAVFLRANAYDDTGAVSLSSGTPALNGVRGGFAHWRRLRRETIGLLLCIDYRPSYRRTLMLLPRTPVIVWSRDPRDHEDWRSIDTLRLPYSDAPPQGIGRIDCSSLAGILEWSRRLGRPFVLATPSAPLAAKIPEAYGIDRPPRVELLPNPLDFPGRPLRKAPTPVVLFLGRFDPIKRPWMFVELARRFPDVEFVMLGQPHFGGASLATAPAGLPPNLRIAGHLEGEAKSREMERAWILVNTSIHEALPVSFQEALAYEIPIVSARNPEQTAARFGVWAGQWDGTGLDGLGAFEEGIARLLKDDALRLRMGREGRAWVEGTHGTERFLDAFERLARRLVPSLEREVTS